MVFFEAGRRIEAVLEDCSTAFGGVRAAAICRELTKAFETIYRGDLDGLLKRHAKDPDMSRGEIVLVIAGADDRSENAAGPDLERIVRILLQEMPASKAASLAARLTDATRREAYELAMRLKKER
jgi:16S rRNA (cytidine1402-2'-O)-methyltransferase